MPKLLQTRRTNSSNPLRSSTFRSNDDSEFEGILSQLPPKLERSINLVRKCDNVREVSELCDELASFWCHGGHFEPHRSAYISAPYDTIDGRYVGKVLMIREESRLFEALSSTRMSILETSDGGFEDKVKLWRKKYRRFNELRKARTGF